MGIRAALVILGKDLRLRLRDRSVLLFAVVVPLGLTFLFSGIMPDTDRLEVRAAVVDEDGGPATDPFSSEVLPALEAEGVLQLVEVADAAEAVGMIEAGDLDAAWVLPEGFGAAVTTGAQARIEVLVGSGRALPGEVARAIAEAFAGRLDGVRLAVATTAIGTGGDLSPQQLTELTARAGTAVADPPLALVPLVAAEEELSATSYLAAGMASFFVFFVVQWGVSGMLEERSLGTMPRLLAAPFPPAAIHLGKAAGAFLLGVASMTVLGVASAFLLGASWGPTLGVAVLVVAIVLAAVGVMALVGSFAHTFEQAGNYQAIVAIVLGMTGGAFFPLPADSLLMRAASAVSPHGWFLRALGEQVGTGDWTAVLPAAGVIVAFGAVAALPAAVRLRRQAAW